jgi:hypothetical protein
MNYPNLVTQEWLDTQRKPEDIRSIRIELSGCFNYRPAPIPGKRNVRYIFPHDPSTSCHALVIPESLWMADDAAMARDLMQTTSHAYTLTMLVLPVSVASPAKAKPLPPAPKVKTRAAKSAEDAAMAILS